MLIGTVPPPPRISVTLTALLPPVQQKPRKSWFVPTLPWSVPQVLLSPGGFHRRVYWFPALKPNGSLGSSGLAFFRLQGENGNSPPGTLVKGCSPAMALAATNDVGLPIAAPMR